MSEIMLHASVMKLPEDAKRHHHRHHQLVVGLQGMAEIDVEGLGAHLDSTHACIVPTDAQHDFYGDRRNSVLVIDLDLDAPLTANPRHPEYESLAPLFERPRLVSMDNQLQTLVQLCSREMAACPGATLMERHFAAGIMHCLSLRLERKGIPRQRACTLNLDSIDRYIEAHMHAKVAVADLAQVACLSVSHFHDAFRSSTGTPPHHYVMQRRLRRAKRLLLETRLSLAEVSLQVGFSSQSAMTTAFRKHLHITPAALRSCRI